jgi:hypothetical protein
MQGPVLEGIIQDHVVKLKSRQYPLSQAVSICTDGHHRTGTPLRDEVGLVSRLLRSGQHRLSV